MSFTDKDVDEVMEKLNQKEDGDHKQASLPIDHITPPLPAASLLATVPTSPSTIRLITNMNGNVKISEDGKSFVCKGSGERIMVSFILSSPPQHLSPIPAVVNI